MALAKWYKIDFHTHTPVSECFRNKNITPVQWLTAAKEAGLDAVVITDHNSVGFISEIDKIQRNANTKVDIKVFYGIELCVSADFTHIIIIFDDKLTTTQIEDAVISDLGLKRENWANTTINVSEDQLKALCKELQGKIFVIPAHFGSEKGLGRSNINEIKKYREFISFSAIEVRTETDVKEYNNKVKQDVLAPCALVTGSDNPSDKDISVHSIEGFGKAFTWVKMSELSFEGLRQVFIDPEHRCINYLQLQEMGEDFNPNLITHNYVAGIIMTDFKHIPYLNVRFSPFLNCIVGGRGTGKSTLVESIRYGLDSSRSLSDCQIIDKTLQEGGDIQTFFNFGKSYEYGIKCTRNKKNLIFTYEDKTGEIDTHPEFKIDFYGQKEIFNLIDQENDDSTEKSPLLKMIDDFIQSKLYSISDEISHSLTELTRLSNMFHDAEKKINELPSIITEIEKDESILSRFKASGLDQKRKRFESIDQGITFTTREAIKFQQHLESTIKLYQDIRDDLGLTYARMADDRELNADAITFIDSMLKSCDTIVDTLLLEKEKNDAQFEIFKTASIHDKKHQLETEYLELVKMIKITGSDSIQTIQDRLQDNCQRRQELESLQKTRDLVFEQLKEQIDIFIKKRLELTRKRIEAVQQMNTEGITISISPFANIIKWKNCLQKEFGKDTYEDEFVRTAEHVLLNDQNYVNYKNFLLFVLTSENGDVSSFVNVPFQQRYVNLWKDKATNGTLSALSNVIPEDRVEIMIKQDGSEIDINDGSPGQKCAALLTLILNIGDNPLIIDQPEDDLDNSLIYNLVVQSIRSMKERRQIIIVTHNPNIPVLGDAEGIIILERKNGTVNFRKEKKAGCIEEKEIRKGICEIMEGGAAAFKKREEKYNSYLV